MRFTTIQNAIELFYVRSWVKLVSLAQCRTSSGKWFLCCYATNEAWMTNTAYMKNVHSVLAFVFAGIIPKSILDLSQGIKGNKFCSKTDDFLVEPMSTVQDKLKLVFHSRYVSGQSCCLAKSWMSEHAVLVCVLSWGGPQNTHSLVSAIFDCFWPHEKRTPMYYDI